MAYVVRRTVSVSAEDRRKLEVVHIPMAQPAQYIGDISPERAIDAFQDGLIRRDFREELGRCKPKTIDHLMSLANEWANGEDSIMVPKSRRRSADHDVDPKDQFHSSS
jgi:hypothetical protein